jgi:hypothetical protein
MNHFAKALVLFQAVTTLATAGQGDFGSFGDYVVRHQTKITGSGKVIQVPIKPLRLSVSTDGVTVRISTGSQGEGWSSFTIYRSDGIGRQARPGGPLEVVPGVQATSDHGGVHKHLRLTRDTLTLTTFPGVSDQTVVIHAVLAPSSTDQPDTGNRVEAEPAP